MSRRLNYYKAKMYFGKLDIDLIEKTLFDGNSDEGGYIIMLAEEDMFYSAALIDLFKLHESKFIGGIFPKIIDQGSLRKRGVIINKISGKAQTFILESRDNTQKAVQPLVDYVHQHNPASAIMYIDGMTPFISNLLSSVYRYLGTSVRYFGGGAGTSDFVQKPVVFTDKGMLENSIAIMFTAAASHISIKHGWEKHKGPLLVTEAKHNIIHTINWEKAFDIYRKALGKEGAFINENNFREYASNYPLAFFRENDEYIIRDPFMVKKDGALVCVGNVDDNALTYIMKGEKEKLKKAAVQSAKESLQQAGSAKNLIVYSCLSLEHFLGSEIHSEMEAIKTLYHQFPHSQDFSGALTLGAFGSMKTGYLEFFTKSVLTGAIHE